MSVSSLPEWKQLLLERKRREEEEREKREKEEEDKLASMPAWKRGIIQRRRMKQESFGDKEREGPLQVKEGRSPSDPSLVLKETIIPVGQNSFIRTHGGWRRGREAERAGEMGHEKGNEQEIEVGRERQKEKERGHVKGHDGESGKGRDIEIQIERYRDRSGGRERDRSAGRERDRSRGRERDRSRGRERDRSAGRETKNLSPICNCTLKGLLNPSRPSPTNPNRPDPLPSTPDLEYQPPHQLPHPSPPPSPSPSPSPTHFTIRSLSGGQQVKRGTTITITPRKPVGGAAVEAVSEGEKGKKRYPTAEEIEVIGGYQNLDKSCLVKTSKASPKGVSVDCRLAYCRLCTINCIDEVSHLVVMIMGSHHLRARALEWDESGTVCLYSKLDQNVHI
uniref:Phostensin n=1 Tax=Oncorhynchus tshawytscha TaxID=74940 RepID=A0AAZ3NPN4_ONCTS